MDSFLSRVVKNIFSKKIPTENLLFVLPNRRAGVYLKKHITNQLQQTSFLPEIITFDNFAEEIAGFYKVSQIEQVIEFYKVYKQLTPPDTTESFELFSNWAPTVLNDFNEIDAYLVDPKSIFTNLKDINELREWNPNTELTKQYFTFFKNLEKYYQDFYNKLIDQKRGYQGLIFRQAVDSIQAYIENTKSHVVFVGFNYLKESESQIIQELLAADKADIYWDISENLLHSNHAAGSYIRKYKAEWGYYKTKDFNWTSTNSIVSKNIEIIGVPKNVGMLKYAGELLKNLETFNETALVLADQNILPVALNSMPKSVEKVNITMGFPLRSFPLSNLIDFIFELFVNENLSDKKPYYHKVVLRILQHPILQTHFSSVSELATSLVEKNSIYFSYDILTTTCKEHEIKNVEDILNLFTPIKGDYITAVLEKIRIFINSIIAKTQGIEEEVLYRYQELINQLLQLYIKNKDLLNLPKGQEGLKSFYKIYKTLLFSENLNFVGEPLQGLQIMGFLETQALHFKHIILTSLNEGILPKGKSYNSFIPFDARMHFNLPTYIDAAAEMSYHFYRLLESTEKVKLLYNNEIDTFGGAEKSQFIAQLLWEYPDMKHSIINPNTFNENNELQQVIKSAAIIEKLNSIAKTGFSPSALATYLYNPIAFYQERVLGIKDLDEIEEIIADNTLGSVIHNTLEQLYKPLIGAFLKVDTLQSLLPKIPGQVKIEFSKVYQLGQYEVGKNRLIYEVILNFIKRFVKSEIKSLKTGQQIKIIALEKNMEVEIDFPKFDFPIKIKGIIDRIDEVDGVQRILDFKSGKVTDIQLRMDDFSKILSDYKFSKALQILLYAYLYTQQKEYDSSKELQAGIVSFKNLNAGFMPVSFGAKQAKDYTITFNKLEEFKSSVETLILEIFDPSIPFIEKE